VRFVIDIDGTLCYNNSADGRDFYLDAVPFQDRIDVVNRLYDVGHTIILDTARGSYSGRNWLSETHQQLREWGVKFHQLRVGRKMWGDYYIDDRAMSEKDFFDEGKWEAFLNL